MSVITGILTVTPWEQKYKNQIQQMLKYTQS